jgi:hypothetical protein
VIVSPALHKVIVVDLQVAPINLQQAGLDRGVTGIAAFLYGYL